eukprot:TRINITY_DN4465_c0_g1_i1.p1 TRINITY_DN4465_c0_g1~~TRINITY_DN4465_c0_g1_i1.p1  ORF type:complete len:248 (+),score=32.78 TRINITY_DN4465_c0_g1_i1:40-744(+)
MVRCVIGLGVRSTEYPFRRAHIGRAFVEHAAEAHDFSRWRPVSSALADICEHGSGIVLCRLWPHAFSNRREGGIAAQQCLRYLGIRSPSHVVVAHAEPRRPCGQFGIAEGAWRAPIWAGDIVEAISPPPLQSRNSSKASSKSPSAKVQGSELPLRLQLGIGSPGHNSTAPGLEQFGESQMSSREAAAVLQTAFPASYEWLLKRWMGPSAITEGAVYRRRLQQDIRKDELKLPKN